MDQRQFKYKGDINTINIKALLDYKKLSIIKEGIGIINITCPFNNSHNNAIISFNDKNIFFNCLDCFSNNIYDFLELYPVEFIDSICEKQAKKPDNIDYKYAVNVITSRYEFEVDFNGMIYLYKGNKWINVEENLIRKFILEAVGVDSFTKKLTNEALHYFMALKQRKEPIVFNNLEPYEIPCKNGVFSVKDKKLRPHRKEDYLLVYADTDYIKGEVNHELLKLTEVWFKNPDLKDIDMNNELDIGRAMYNEMNDVSALQEFCGFVLMLKAKYKKALMLYGDGDTGKSIIAGIITDILNVNNTCTIYLDKMDDQQCLAPIKGKMVNIIYDLKKDAMLSDGGFKTLVSGGDAIQINTKYKPQETIIPDAKHIFITNNLPVITDTTTSVFKRFVFLQFKNVIEESKQDSQLKNKLLENKPGILNWMIEGAIRLYENDGKFTQSEGQIERLSKYRRDSNPMSEFIDECLICDSDSYIKLSEIKDKYREFSNNYRVSSKHICKTLRDMGISVENKWIMNKNHLIVKGFKIA